jgi:hypothetical protein
MASMAMDIVQFGSNMQGTHYQIGVSEWIEVETFISFSSMQRGPGRTGVG